MISLDPISPRALTLSLLACAVAFAAAGCNAPGKPGPEPEVPRPEQVLDFATLYSQNCAACHGKDGKGQTMMGRKLGVKDFTDPKVQASFDDALATKTIKEGKKDKDDKTLMKSFGMLWDDEIKALVANVRGFNK